MSGYHGSSKMAVTAAALLSPSITASLAVLQIDTFRDCGSYVRHVPSALNNTRSLLLCILASPVTGIYVKSKHRITIERQNKANEEVYLASNQNFSGEDLTCKNANGRHLPRL